MIITLYGPDDFRRESKKKEIADQFKAKHPGAEVGVFDFSETDGFEAFKAFAGSQSMFESAKLAVVSNIAEGELKPVTEAMKSYLEDNNITILISESRALPKKLEFLTKTPAKKKSPIAQKFELLKGKDFEKFVVAYAAKEGLKMEDGALALIAKIMPGNSWRAATEIDKAACLGKKNIGASDLGGLATELKPDFWALVNGFKSPDVSARIAALNSIFASGEPAGKMFNILAYQLPQKTKAIARYDLLVKSGKMDYEEALVDLAIN